ncbi:MAG: hypothetical protein ACP5U2_01610 [Bryobacteraceae bacterium]
MLENVGPKQSLVLARLSGGPLEKTGVLQGMSGSPVYLEGRLVGAVAMAFPFSKEPIAAIRPIQDMLAVREQDQPARRAARVSPFAATPTAAFAPRAELLAGGQRLVEIGIPPAHDRTIRPGIARAGAGAVAGGFQRGRRCPASRQFHRTQARRDDQRAVADRRHERGRRRHGDVHRRQPRLRLRAPLSRHWPHGVAFRTLGSARGGARADHVVQSHGAAPVDGHHHPGSRDRRGRRTGPADRTGSRLHSPDAAGQARRGHALGLLPAANGAGPAAVAAAVPDGGFLSH